MAFGARLATGLVAAGLTAVASLALPAPAEAQLYRGKTVTMIINYPAGGPSDIEGRIMVQYLPAHIPGNPRMIIRNVSGGGGMIGLNHLGEIAKPDGETFGYITMNPIAEILGDPGQRVKFADFELVGGVDNPLVVYARKDTPPGLASAADIMKAKGFRTLSLDSNSSNTFNLTIALDLLGMPFRPVHGYKGLKEVETAILQNEGQVANTSLPGWLASIVPTMAKQGIVIPLWQVAAPGPGGTYPRAKAIPDIPTFEEFFAAQKGGAKPSGIAYEAMRAFMDPQTSMFRAILFPPKTPKETVEILSKAYVSMWKDPKFQETYQKVVKSEPGLVIGDQAEAIMSSLTKVKPEVKAFLGDHSKRVSSK
jgi:tripartite-type tricarboxylate transporter receptor subunit TctC